MKKFAMISDDFDARIQEIIPTLQRLKHGENGLTNANLEFQAKKIGVETSELKRWVNNHHDLLNQIPDERVRCKCNGDGSVHKW